MITDLSEPIKIYNSALKEEVKNRTIEYFDELVTTSGIDIEANRTTCKELYSKETEFEQVSNKLRKKKSLRVFLIVLMIVLSVIGIFSFFFIEDILYPILISACAVIYDIIALVIILKKINPLIRKLYDDSKKIKEIINELKEKAWAQMTPLNLLYDWNIPATIINRSNDLIVLDKFFDVKKFQYLKEKFGFQENKDQNISVRSVQSGSILGNPFLICKNLKQYWYNREYTGSIVIHWTETVSTKDGVKTVNRSQTLTASITKPAVDYKPYTYLIYGNEAAPNLSFSRGPSGASELSEKKLEKKVEKAAKNLDKKAKKELMDDDPTTNYVRFSNDEFETIFGGIDRDNEVEYRLLFTPLAQRNLLEILKNPIPYGDDFYLTKMKKINIVESKHSQNFNYKANPEIFEHFDYDKARERFINYNTKFFESFYFDLAPLISIPLYQQTRTSEYIYNEEYTSNITSYEHESIANSFNPKLFCHPETDTATILKTKLINKEGKFDKVSVTAYSFKEESRVEYVTKRGGDGRYHQIPIKWYEYIPLVEENQMIVEEKKSSRLDYYNRTSKEEFRSALNLVFRMHLYERGLFAAILANDFTSANADTINEVYNDDNEEITQDTLRNRINNAINEMKRLAEEAKNSTTSSSIAESSSVDSNISSSANQNK